MRPPVAPGPCDLCGATPAPFGFRVIGAGRRPLRACGPCRPAAEARFQAARARRDPTRAGRPPLPPPAPRTPDLFARD